MRSNSFSVFLCLVLAMTASIAKPCIKVRDAHESYTCMKFSKAEQQKAKKLGVQYGSSYKATHDQLRRSGWSIYPGWLNENPKEAKQGLPVCGQGFDAVCSIALEKGKLKIELVFSGVSPKMPLVGIDGEL